MDYFSRYHGYINFSYFAILIASSFLYMNIWMIMIIFISMTVYGIHLLGWKTIGKNLVFSGVLMTIAFVINPLLNHRGVTQIGTFLDNPVTLESVLFGLVSAAFLGAVLMLFTCFNQVMSFEKMSVVLAPITPKFALVFSLAMWLIHKLQKDYRQIRQVQKVNQKGKNPMKAIDCLIGISLEDTMDTSHSMTQRGYTLSGKKTHFGRKFTKRDGRMLVILLILGGTMGYLYATSTIQFAYFPVFVIPKITVQTGAFYCIYAIFANIPMLLEGKEKVKWNRINGLYWK